MSLVKEAPITHRDQIKTLCERISRAEVTLKLIRDRAQFAIEFADGSDDDRAIIGGLLAQFKAIIADADALN